MRNPMTIFCAMCLGMGECDTCERFELVSRTPARTFNRTETRTINATCRVVRPRSFARIVAPLALACVLGACGTLAALATFARNPSSSPARPSPAASSAQAETSSSETRIVVRVIVETPAASSPRSAETSARPSPAPASDGNTIGNRGPLAWRQ